MEKEEYWESFLASGKVADYLCYCRASSQESEEIDADKRPEDKVKQNAGFY